MHRNTAFIVKHFHTDHNPRLSSANIEAGKIYVLLWDRYLCLVFLAAVFFISQRIPNYEEVLSFVKVDGGERNLITDQLLSKTFV